MDREEYTTKILMVCTLGMAACLAVSSTVATVWFFLTE